MEFYAITHKKIKIHTNWGVFVKEHYRKDSTKNHQEIMDNLSDQWRGLTEDQQRVYDQKARDLEVRDNANPRVGRQTGWSYFQKMKWPGYKADGMEAAEIRARISAEWSTADKNHWKEAAKIAV